MVTTCARPPCSTTSGVPQLSISCRSVRQSFGAGLRVERDDERRSLVIPLDDDPVAVQDRRLPFAELLAHLLVAEIFLPEQLAVHVVGVEPERVEEGVDALAVGDRRRRGVGAPLLDATPRAADLRARCAPRSSCRSCDRAPSRRTGAARACARRRAARAPPRRSTPTGTADSTNTLSPQIDRRCRIRGRGSRPSSGCSSSRSTRSADSPFSTRRWRRVRATAASTSPTSYPRRRAPASAIRSQVPPQAFSVSCRTPDRPIPGPPIRRHNSVSAHDWPFDFALRTRVVFGDGTLDQLGAAGARARVLARADRCRQGDCRDRPGRSRRGAAGRRRHRAVLFSRLRRESRHATWSRRAARTRPADGIDSHRRARRRQLARLREGHQLRPDQRRHRCATTAATARRRSRCCRRSASRRRPAPAARRSRTRSSPTRETHAKMACGDAKAAFRIAILDPALTVSQPRAVTAVAGYDAISHAVEPYVTTRRTQRLAICSRARRGACSRANYERVLAAPRRPRGARRDAARRALRRHRDRAVDARRDPRLRQSADGAATARRTASRSPSCCRTSSAGTPRWSATATRSCCAGEAI